MQKCNPPSPQCYATRTFPVLLYIFGVYTCHCWCQWPRGLRCKPVAAHLLGLRVRIPPGAWMSVSCEYCTGWSRSLCAPDDFNTKKHAKIQYFKVSSQNTFGIWTVLYWTRSSRTQFGMSINVWRLTGNTLNITCNFLYCNHQVHRDFLNILYVL